LPKKITRCSIKNGNNQKLILSNKKKALKYLF
jgi:hypothetical protein